VSNRKRTRPRPGQRPAGPAGYLGSRPEPVPEGITWTPLESACGCVIDWGWGGDGTANPLSFIMFVVRAFTANCPWHGAESGQPVQVPRSGVIRFQNGPAGQQYIYVRRAAGTDITLGQRLTRELRQALTADDDELTAGAPYYAAWLREEGEDAAEAIRQQRLTDLILNRGHADTVTGMNDFEEHLAGHRRPGESRAETIERLRREAGYSGNGGDAG
jgi:hypothetical protein